MNKEEKIAELLMVEVADLKNNCKQIEDCKAVYYWNPVRGGLSIIVDENGEYLVATSSVSPEKHLEEFKNGRRNGKL